MKIMTVHEMRRLGYTVCVNHCRRYVNPLNKTCYYLTDYQRSISGLPDYVIKFPTGGITVVHILNPSLHFYRSGVAKCSTDDNYNKKAGVKLAIQRALDSVVDLYIK